MVRRVCEYQGGAFVSPLLLAVRGGHHNLCQVPRMMIMRPMIMIRVMQVMVMVMRGTAITLSVR